MITGDCTNCPYKGLPDKCYKLRASTAIANVIKAQKHAIRAAIDLYKKHPEVGRTLRESVKYFAYAELTAYDWDIEALLDEIHWAKEKKA